MSLLASAFLLAQTEAPDAAEEGVRIIRAMLIVGLVFLTVIALGELVGWLRHRRR